MRRCSTRSGEDRCSSRPGSRPVLDRVRGLVRGRVPGLLRRLVPGLAAGLIPGLVAGLCSALAMSPIDAAARSEGAADLGARVRALQERSGVPYVDLAVMRSEGPCTDTRYSDPVPRIHAASISKLLTATVLLQFVDAGRLELDDPVGRWVPAFEGSGIRVRHLLTHTSGLRDRQRPQGRDRPAQVERYLRALAEQRPAAAPGERWIHADANFNLLGRVLEVLGGEPFAEIMRAHLLAPLGMLDSTFALDEVPEVARVAGYVRRFGLLWPQQAPRDLAFAPSSGLQTTAADLGRFVRAVLLAAEGMDDARLHPETIRRMTRPVVALPGATADQGLAWRIDDTSLGARWYLGGGAAGREGLLSVYPELGFGVVVLGNLRGWPRAEFAAELAGAVGGADVCRLWR